MEIAAWQGPPKNMVGQPATIQQFVVRTDQVVIVVQRAIAFREGCLFDVHVAVRRGSLDEIAWNAMLESQSRGGPRPKAADIELVFGVEFPDGSKATTADNAVDGWQHPIHPPESPVFIESGNGYGNSDHLYQSDRRLWLWPLPPPAAFELFVEWEKLGVRKNVTTVDGNAIVRAAQDAEPYWP